MLKNNFFEVYLYKLKDNIKKICDHVEKKNKKRVKIEYIRECLNSDSKNAGDTMKRILEKVDKNPE
jgi:hypothetical protein